MVEKINLLELYKDNIIKVLKGIEDDHIRMERNMMVLHILFH